MDELMRCHDGTRASALSRADLLKGARPPASERVPRAEGLP